MKRALSRPEEATDQSSRTIADSVYHRLRSDIVWGVFAPDTPLRSDELRSVYDVGISPLREALTRLVGESLVTSVGQRGFRVAPLEAADVLDTMETRILIESEALRLSIGHANIQWETNLVAAAHALKRVTPPPREPGPANELWADLHYRFHMALLAGCGSPGLIKLAHMLFVQAERHRLRAVRFPSPTTYRDRPAEHEAIFSAALARNAKLATAELDRHYRLSARHVVETITAVEAAPSSAPCPPTIKSQAA